MLEPLDLRMRSAGAWIVSTVQPLVKPLTFVQALAESLRVTPVALERPGDPALLLKCQLQLAGEPRSLTSCMASPPPLVIMAATLVSVITVRRKCMSRHGSQGGGQDSEQCDDGSVHESGSPFGKSPTLKAGTIASY